MKCEKFQRTKRSTKQYIKFPPKLADKIPRNKVYVDIIGPYKICRKGKETSILKSITIIDPVNGLFLITQYND